MKTLVVVAHPNLHESKANKRWLEELKKHEDKFIVHNIYDYYSDFKIDIKKEQTLIESCDRLILQFPIYWFSSPALLKQWIDDVFAYGWAYGSTGDKMKGRKVALAVTLGADEADHLPDGEVKYSVEEMLRPYEMMCIFTGADYKGVHAFYSIGPDVTDEFIESSIKGYMDFMTQFASI